MFCHYKDNRGYTYLTCHYDSDTGCCVKCGRKLGTPRLIDQDTEISKIIDKTMTQDQKELLHDYEVDVADCEKAVKAAEEELQAAKDWLAKQKLHYAEAIIKLNEFKKTIK